VVLQADIAKVGVGDHGDDVEDEQHGGRKARAKAQREQHRKAEFDAGAEQRRQRRRKHRHRIDVLEQR